jgi:pimeloyl-ACP methyl ester carboxylesterase
VFIREGSGPPLVLIPGLQGRWEYLAPTLHALAATFTVTTFALCDEPGANGHFDPLRAFDSYVAQVAEAVRQSGRDRAVICGVSFGGLIALSFAAAHPECTTALVLASTPGPGWRLLRRHLLYVRLPRLCGPLFLLEAPLRLGRELRATFPARADRRRFVAWHLRLLLSAPLSPSRMAARAERISTLDTAGLGGRVVAPTLLVTGEPALDYVVPTCSPGGYERLIRGARSIVLERTGHLGSITRPHVFAAIVQEFVGSLAALARTTSTPVADAERLRDNKLVVDDDFGPAVGPE